MQHWYLGYLTGTLQIQAQLFSQITGRMDDQTHRKTFVHLLWQNRVLEWKKRGRQEKNIGFFSVTVFENFGGHPAHCTSFGEHVMFCIFANPWVVRQSCFGIEDDDELSLAKPKSANFTSSVAVNSTFSGFRSRWTTFFEWRNASPAVICRIYLKFIKSLLGRWRRSFKFPPT